MVNEWLNIKHKWRIPVDCLYCRGETTGDLPLCELCRQQLPKNLSFCPSCAEPLSIHTKQPLCGKCLKSSPAYDLALSPYLYQAPISNLITRFKFHSDLCAGQLLAKLLADHLQQELTQLPGCIIPVPLHSTRLMQRGFNQSHELAGFVAKQLSLPVLTGYCIRQRHTDSQSGLDEKQRKQNIRRAFTMVKALPYQHVAIIDDVMTTGNTVNELAKVLRQGGATMIQVWCVSRASNQ